MTFLLINTTNKKAIALLGLWYKNHRRPYIRDKEWFIRKFGVGTYLLDANGATLALLLDLRKRYNGNVYIYAVHPLHEKEFPKEVIKEVNRCLNNKIYLTKENLETLSKIHLDCSMNLNERQ